MPAGRLPREAVRKILLEHRAIFNELEQGARREECDWELDRREEGYTLDLEDIQSTRQLARLIALAFQRWSDSAGR